MDEEGYREILDFAVYPKEGASVWEELLRRLVERGVREVLLVVAIRLAGIEEAIKAVFPRADVQRCVVHTLHRSLAVRRKDWEEVRRDLRAMLDARDRKEALSGSGGEGDIRGWCPAGRTILGSGSRTSPIPRPCEKPCEARIRWSV